MDLLYSKVHDERQCVTLKAVSIELGVDRCVAARMMEDLPYYNTHQNCTYEITRTIRLKDVGKPCCVKLQKSRLSITPNSTKSEEDQEGDIVSIALVQDKAHGGSNGATSAKVGQAYSMAMLFDALVDGNYDILAPIVDPNMANCRFKPHQQVLVSDKYQMRDARIYGALPSSTNDVMAKSLTLSTQLSASTRVEPVRKSSVETHPTKGSKTSGNKVTTAASFFQATNANDKSKAASSKKTSNSSGGKKAGPAETKHDAIAMSDPAAPKEEKENVKNATSRSSTQGSLHTKNTQEEGTVPPPPPVASQGGKGFADDFVGDQDEDDEFLRLEEQRMKRLSKDMMTEKEQVESTHVAARPENLRMKVAHSRDRQDDTLDDEDGDSKKVAIKGAMDMFSTKLTQPTQSGVKRRKQVLEERTYQDEHGYLKTETVCVWKECDDPVEPSGKTTEESSLSDTVGQSKAPEPNRKTSTAAKNTKNMKQSNLSGFFTVKK